MKDVKSVVTAVILTVLMAIPGFASAQMGPGMGMHHGLGMGPGPGFWAANLNLTPDQMRALETIRINFFKETIPQRNQLMVARMELRSLWSQPNPDPAAILAKQKQINSLRDQIIETAVRYRLDARKVLTPEQIGRLQAMRRPFHYGHGKWHPRTGPGYGIGCGYCMGYPGMGPGYGMGAYGRPCPCGSGPMYGRGPGCWRSW